MRILQVLAGSILLLSLGWMGTPGLAADQPPSDAETEAGDANRFTVGIEDQLRIVVWGEPDLSLDVKVRPDGKITIPLIHDLHVEGLTPEEIRSSIASKLSDYVRNPNVTVIVEEINSFRVYFIGEIQTPGALLFYRPIRVLQAISMAGGPTEFSKGGVTILREEYGVEKRIQIDYKKLLTGSPGQENIYLKPGDTVIFK